MNDLAFNLPLNSLSFGQVSTLILREIFALNKDPILYSPIGSNIDLSSQTDIQTPFQEWISKSINNFSENYSNTIPIFKLWHLNGSLESFSKKQYLLSFYELDTPTKTEINIVRNNEKVFFSSKETCETFKTFGCKNVHFLPLAFDKYNFYKTDKVYFEDRITFNLTGKLEARKHHEKIIKLWLKKYGNNPKFFLNCAIFNPFLKAEDQQKILINILGNKRYFNISFLNYMQNNSAYNDYLNSGDIILGMSGGEGWGLPEFHSVALGKHAVILNCNGYKSWATQDNSVLIEPSSKKELLDNIFFKKGSPFNQGNFYDFKDEDFINGCEEAVKRVEKEKINKIGFDLQKKFSSEKLYKNITENCI